MLTLLTRRVASRTALLPARMLFSTQATERLYQNDWTQNKADYSQFLPAFPEEQQTDFGNYEDVINKDYDIKPVDIIGMESRRCGTLAVKVGMTQIFDKWGGIIPCTVLHVDRVQVTGVYTFKQNGFNAVQVGIGEKKIKKVTKAYAGQFLKNGIPPKQHQFTFKITPENFLPIGYMVGPRHFNIGQYVDVISTSIGKGTQGVMKRWNFSGNNASHGCSRAHRSAGSIGQCEFPGKVWKGRKMAGKMGNKRTTIQNQQVVKIDNERSLIYIHGQVPGPTSAIVRIRDAVKKSEKQYQSLMYPTWIEGRDRAIESQWTWEGPEQDPFEDYIHENDCVSGQDVGGDD